MTLPRTYERILIGVLGLSVLVYVASEAWRHQLALSTSAGVLLALCVPAMAASYLAAVTTRRRTARLSLAFILTGFLLLPTPGGAMIALAACLAGYGGGVVGPFTSGIAGFAAVAASTIVAQFLVSLLPAGTVGSPWAALALLALLFALIQSLAINTGRLLGHRPGSPRVLTLQPSWRTLLLETINIPIALVLVRLLSGAAWVPAVAASAVILVAQATLIRMDRAAGDLRLSRDALSSRLAELDTLHAIGREILSTMDPAKICAIIERECRKIFEIDYYFVALHAETESRLELVYDHTRQGQALFEIRLLERGLATLVADRKHGLRIEDFDAYAADSPMRGSQVGPGMRSGLVVPLIVEDRVIGVLGIQNARPHAFDDHQLTVLTTIAQQAAVAIDNARHFQMATVDSLTRFFHRDYFFKRLEEEYRRCGRYGGQFSVLMLDLDGFKEINDRHGHMNGDQFLREISDTIRRQLRQADLACRYGGDEFCVLLPETDFEGAKVIAERIREAISRKIVGLEGLAVRTTASIGLAAFPDHDTGEAQSLVRDADEALYRAKRAGRDRVAHVAA